MGSLVDKATKTLETKNNIKGVLRSKGVSVSDDLPFSAYPNLIQGVGGGLSVITKQPSGDTVNKLLCSALIFEEV